MSVDKMVLLREGPAFNINVQHHIRITDDDIIAFAVARSKPAKEASLQQPKVSEKLIEG
jgi:hypothetical protein